MTVILEAIALSKTAQTVLLLLVIALCFLPTGKKKGGCHDVFPR